MSLSVDSDRDLISYYIKAYSTLLQHLPQSDTSRPAIPRNHDLALLGQFYNHLATLLNTGASDDVNSNRVVSVTGGPITKDHASVTIVSENDSPKAHIAGEKLPRRYEVITVQPSDNDFEEVMRRVVDSETNSNESLSEFHNHISDVLCVLQAFTSGKSANSPIMVQALFETFIFRRCRLGFTERLHGDSRLWKEHLAELLVTWEPLHSEFVEPVWVPTPIPDRFLQQVAALSSIQTRTQGFSDGACEIRLDKQSARTLVHGIATMLKELQNNFPLNRSGGAPVSPGAHVERKYVRTVLQFSIMLSWGVTKRVFAAPSLCYTLSEARTPRQSGVLKRGAHDFPASYTLEPLSRENDEGHPGWIALRHLQSIGAWSSAVRSILAGLMARNLSLQVTLIKVPLQTPQSPVLLPVNLNLDDLFQECVWESARSMKKTPNLEHFHSLYGDGQVPQDVSGTVHAEAALMALAFACNSPDPTLLAECVPADQANVCLRTLQDGPGVLGVSRKSCWCCFHLGEILSETVNHEISFMVPGTHGRVFAWAPPPGLPMEVLNRMRDDLRLKLVNLLRMLVAEPFVLSSSSSSFMTRSSSLVNSRAFPAPRSGNTSSQTTK